MKNYIFCLAYIGFLTNSFGSSEMFHPSHSHEISNRHNQCSNLNLTDEIEIIENDKKNLIFIDAADLNITDDSIASAFKYPQPLSVTEACIEIEKYRSSTKNIIIDLNSNTICDEGSEIIANTLLKLPSLINLDISWNRINDSGIKQLIKKLWPIILNPNFKELDITANYGANLNNIEQAVIGFPSEQQRIVTKKIKI